MMSETIGCPYPGPRPFLRTERDRFYGRSRDTGLLAEWWRNNRLTLVVGQAGCGKTSLLRAGVLPLLSDGDLTILPAGRFSYGASFPFAALPAHNPYTLALLHSWAPGETATRLADLTVQEFIQRQVGHGVVLAAIDPADELLAGTGPRRAHQRRFLGELKEALAGDSRLHLLVVGREEAIGVIAGALGGGARYEVKALTWQSALEAVIRPAADAGRSFADGAAEKLVTDLQTSLITGDDGRERYVSGDRAEPPLLQIACAHLWGSLSARVDSITVRDIRRYGDVDTALAAYCGMVMAQIADDQDVPTKRLASWLLGTFVTELGTRDKAYEGATTTAGMPNAVARALEDRYLLTARPEAGSRWYELLSDRLIEPLRMVGEVRPSAPAVEDYLSAAERALTLGQLDLAERHAEEILRTMPGSGPRPYAKAYSLLGNLAYEREKPKDAEVRYRDAARLFGAAGDSKAVAYQLTAVGQMLLAQGRITDAAEELHAAVARLPNDLVVQAELAEALWQDDKGPAAVAILNDVLRLDGGNRAALRARGEILAYLGQARQAMLDLDRVTLHGRPSTRAARGLALAGLGDQAAARREIEGALAEGRRNGPVLLYAALAFHAGGDDSAAKEFAGQAADAADPPLSPPHRAAARQLAGRKHG
jgi:tetratricopeptide (TPR) repeat protein